MDNKNTDLLPCPFCGGEAVSGVELYSINDYSLENYIEMKAIVRCSDRCTERSVLFKGAKDRIGCSLMPFEEYTNAFERVKKLWNTRTNNERNANS